MSSSKIYLVYTVSTFIFPPDITTLYGTTLSKEKAVEMCKAAAKVNSRSDRAYVIEAEIEAEKLEISEFDSIICFNKNGTDMLSD